MKRYLVFEYDAYYPTGGLSDLTGMFDTEQEVRETKSRAQYADVLDTQTGMCMHGRGVRSRSRRIFEDGSWKPLKIED